MRNRNESLLEAPDASGVACQWEWTSDLHIASVFPSTGLRLMKRALDDFPIALVPSRKPATDPEVSVVIGHAGEERQPLLLKTLASFGGQEDVRLQCIVVEQSPRPAIQNDLPDWVDYRHVEVPPGAPYNRARAFNTGVELATASTLVLHDNDILVPCCYARVAVDRLAQGWDFANLKRFIFYLSEKHSRVIEGQTGGLLARTPQAVVQNALGGSIAATKKAYLEIGGFDESFEGWGSEDNEFWDRAGTRRVWDYGHLPMVHLWHRAQKEKLAGSQAPSSARYRELESVDPAQRIRRLRTPQSLQ